MKAVITISREVGSGGDQIGYELAHALGYTCVNKGFVDLVARKTGTLPWQLTRAERAERLATWARPSWEDPVDVLYDEGESRSLGDLFRRLGYGVPLAGQEYVEAVRTVMLDLAEVGRVVIIGRGGQILLHDHPEAFHIRVVAGDDRRIERVSRQAQVGRSRAERTLRMIDSLRVELLRELGCTDINDPALYDLVLCTDDKSSGECVGEVLRALTDPVTT